MDLRAHARRLLEDPDYRGNARAAMAMGVGNTDAAGVMSMTIGAPRWETERAVRAALAQIDDEAEEEAMEEAIRLLERGDDDV